MYQPWTIYSIFMFLKLEFLLIFRRGWGIDITISFVTNEFVKRWKIGTFQLKCPWENEQNYRFQKHQKMNKSSMFHR